MKELTPTMVNALDTIAFRLNHLKHEKAAVQAWGKTAKGVPRRIDPVATEKALLNRGLIERVEKGVRGPRWYRLTEAGQKYVEEHGLGKG